MKQEITAQVVMLPTKKSMPNINSDDTLSYSDAGGFYIDIGKKSHKLQHLYVISDEKQQVKVGDWIYRNEMIFKASIADADEFDYCVIASTDPTLGLPTIPLTWIKDVYVRSNGTIMTVRLELEFNHALKSMATESRIKLTPNNEVVIVDEPHTIYTHPEENADYLDKISNLLDKMNNIIDKKPTSDKELEMAAEQYTAGNSLEYAYMQEIPAFKAGAEWQKEQSANETIEFAIWTHENKWTTINKEPLWYNKDRYYQDKKECLTSQQLYKLYQQTKKQ